MTQVELLKLCLSFVGCIAFISSTLAVWFYLKKDQLEREIHNKNAGGKNGR